MPLGVLGKLPSSTLLPPAPSSHTFKASAPFGWIVLFVGAVIYPSIFPLVSFTGITDFLRYLLRFSSPNSSPSLLTAIMKSVRLSKSPVKTLVVQHDDHPDHHIDPACPICQVDIGTKSPEGIKEGYAVTPCGHVFGNVCIKKYLAITDKPQCPFCRTDLFHVCLHPILPASYDAKKSNMTLDEAAAKAFPSEPQQIDCTFCAHLKLKLARRLRRHAVLQAATRGGSSTSGSEEDSDSDGSGSPSRATKGMRLALNMIHITAALARLTLDAARIRKIKVPPEEQDNINHHRDDYFEEDGEIEGDIVVEGSPRLSTTPNRHLPPIPGPYGHWDLANKGPDWKFLAWFDSQEPKMKTTPEHFS